MGYHCIDNLPPPMLEEFARHQDNNAGYFELARLLGGWWRLAAAALWLIPRPLADAAYRLVAAIRYRLFGRPAESCPLLPPEFLERFDLRCDE